MTFAALPLSDLTFHGRGLSRPECVLAHERGFLFAADWTPPGGVAIVDTETGAIKRHLAADPSAGLKPNGILLDDDGSFVITHLGDSDGGVFRLHPDGSVDTILSEVDGAPLPPTNFAAKDAAGRLYITVSTRHVPRHLAANGRVRDGFIVLLANGAAPRIVADDLGYTNECAFSADGRTLFVNETFGRSTSTFSIREDGTLGPMVVAARYGDGIFPDGLTLDSEGSLWITSIISNTVLRVRPNEYRQVILEDRDPPFVAQVERAYGSSALDRTLLDAAHTGALKNISSLAFGGPDLRTIYLGCLLGDSIASFRSPVAGAKPAHFDVDLAPLERAGALPV